MRVGQTHRLPAPEAQKVRVETGRVLGVQQQGSFLNIRARAPGRSKLYIDSVQHQFIVLPGAVLSGFESLKQQVRRLPGLSFKVVGTEAHIYGRLQKIQHWQALSRVGVPYRFKAQIDRPIQLQTQLFFSELVRQQHLPMPVFNWQAVPQVQMGGKSLLPVKNLRRLLAPYGLAVQHEPEALFVEPTVRLQVVLAEVNKRWGRQWGLLWSEEAAWHLFRNPSKVLLSSLLKTMEANGQGKVLARPTLLCRNKGEAQFLAGGEFGVVIKTRSKTKVLWKPHGVILKLKPQVGLQGRMKLDMEVEVSMLDHSQQLPEGVPSLKTNRFSSQFDVLQSQTLYLSGLVQNVEGSSAKGWAYLTRLPILGALFSSREFTRNNTSLVVFVTPQQVRH